MVEESRDGVDVLLVFVRHPSSSVFLIFTSLPGRSILGGGHNFLGSNFAESTGGLRRDVRQPTFRDDQYPARRCQWRFLGLRRCFSPQPKYHIHCLDHQCPGERTVVHESRA